MDCWVRGPAPGPGRPSRTRTLPGPEGSGPGRRERCRRKHGLGPGREAHSRRREGRKGLEAGGDLPPRRAAGPAQDLPLVGPPSPAPPLAGVEEGSGGPPRGQPTPHSSPRAAAGPSGEGGGWRQRRRQGEAEPRRLGPGARAPRRAGSRGCGGRQGSPSSCPDVGDRRGKLRPGEARGPAETEAGPQGSRAPSLSPSPSCVPHRHPLPVVRSRWPAPRQPPGSLGRDELGFCVLFCFPAGRQVPTKPLN